VQEKEGNEIDTVMSSYYGEEQVTAIINLKVDTKSADTIAEAVSKYGLVEDVFLVTGDTDIVVKTKFHNYNQLKRFLVDDISNIDGVKDTKTLMVVTTFKERGKIVSESQEPNVKQKMGQILEVLDQLAEDTSVPRNIRRGATEAKAKLEMSAALDVRVAGAIGKLDDLANDPNIPMHGRTIIYRIITELENLLTTAQK
jgi:uncharacterized protein (UPF0147 family)